MEYIQRVTVKCGTYYNDQDDLMSGRMEVILVVDDEPDLVDTACCLINGLGYVALDAYSGLEALRIIKSGRRIDLLFSDVVMPGGVNGFQLAQEIFKERHNIKILLTSAHIVDDDIISANPQITGLLRSLLKKPYSKSQLELALRNTLDSAG